MFQNPILNEILTKYRENKLAHAYLIETNNLDLALKDIKELIKNLNCPHNFTSKCTECNLCNLINLNNLPSLKIIEPDGTNIKKNQIEDLKNNFSTKPLYSKFNIYILKNAEKLNASSANAMLKFVEEPTPGILGFFLTSNKDIMIDTIKSRCQIFTLSYEVTSLYSSLNISKELYAKYLAFIPSYLDDILKNKLINHKKTILSLFPERQDIENILKIILSIYYEHYLKLNNKPYQTEITNIYPLNLNIQEISQKLQIITKIITNMSYNVSIELILDKFVIEMRGNYE